MIANTYKEKKGLLFEAFSLVHKHGILPVVSLDNEITAQDLEELKQRIDDEIFIISVCGQIKAGKSALLNHLLFGGHEVLPESATPWTAKLTKILYSEKVGFTATFYSDKEWQGLKNLVYTDTETGAERKYFSEHIKPLLEKSAKAGIYDVDVIGSPAKVHRSEDVSLLQDYVSAEGKFQPFVSAIELYSENLDLKDVVIVDTPGLNDPNEFRSNQTVNWVIQSSAVVYLFNSGQPLSREDLNFIDRHLLSIPSEKIVFALSKMDLVGSIERVKQYVETNLRNHKALRDRDLLQNTGAFPISVYAANIHAKLKTGVELNDDESIAKTRLENSGQAELISSAGYLPEFQRGIDEQLMVDKGAAILASGVSTVKSVLEGKRRELLTTAAQIEMNLDSLNKTVDELEAEKQAINDLRQRLRKLESAFDKRLLNELSSINNNLVDPIDIFMDNARQDLISWVNANIEDIENLIQLSSIQIRSAIRDRYREFKQEFVSRQLTGRIEGLVDRYKNEIRSVSEQVLDLVTDNIFSPTPRFKEMMDTALDHARDVKPSILEDCRVRVWDIPILWTDKSETASRIKKVLFDSMEEIRENIQETFKGFLDAEVNEYADSLKDAVTKFLNIRSKDIHQLIQQIDESDLLRKRYDDELAININARSELEGLRKEIESLIEQV
jgi:GTPase Era involved in 16S rRNA processing